jgi:hypothetical protein
VLHKAAKASSKARPVDFDVIFFGSKDLGIGE